MQTAPSADKNRSEFLRLIEPRIGRRDVEEGILQRAFESGRANTKEAILDVDGMTCSSCVCHVEGAFRKSDGSVHRGDGPESQSARTHHRVSAGGEVDEVELFGAGALTIAKLR